MLAQAGDDGYRAAEDQHDAAAAGGGDAELQPGEDAGAGGGAAAGGGEDPGGDPAAPAQQRGQRNHLGQAQSGGEAVDSSANCALPLLIVMLLLN